MTMCMMKPVLGLPEVFAERCDNSVDGCPETGA